MFPMPTNALGATALSPSCRAATLARLPRNTTSSGREGGKSTKLASRAEWYGTPSASSPA